MNSFKRDWRIAPGIWLLVLAVSALAIYFSGLHIWYYGDDFQYVYEDPVARIFYFFYSPNFTHGFYRPVNSAIIAVVQLLFGRVTWPIHIINILVHALLAWMVFLFMRREKFTVWQGVLGSAFMVLSQENASAVLGNDTFSQISGTFFGCLSLWLLYRASPRDADSAGASAAGVPAVFFLLALLAYAISLASKETSVAFGPMVFCFFVIRNRRLPWGGRLLRSIVEVLPFLALTLLYIWVRSAIGLSQPSGNVEGGYGFSVGVNVLRNLAQFLFAAIVPASSVTAFTAVKQRELLLLGVIVLGSLLFLGAVLYGLRRSGRGSVLAVMLLFSLLGLVPAIFMNHVGELYLYNSMPFISVLVGAGLGALLERSMGSRPVFAAVAAFLVVMAISHIVAIQSKASLMMLNGRRAAMYLPQILRMTDRVPPDGTLLLLNPEEGAPEYSVFQMKPFSVYKWGVHIFRQEANRWDMTVEVVERPELDLLGYADAMVLGLEGDSVVVWKEAGAPR